MGFYTCYMLKHNIGWSNRLTLVIVRREAFGDASLDQLEICNLNL